jgi:hypothetical protein
MLPYPVLVRAITLRHCISFEGLRKPTEQLRIVRVPSLSGTHHLRLEVFSVGATPAHSVRLLAACALTHPSRYTVAAYDRVALQGPAVANHSGVHPVGTETFITANSCLLIAVFSTDFSVLRPVCF